MKGGGFKVRPVSRCTSAVRRPVQELAVLDLYQQATINVVPQLFMTPTQRQLRQRPKTGMKMIDQNYGEVKMDNFVRQKTALGSQRSQRTTKQSTRGQLETIADNLLKKTSVTINEVDQPTGRRSNTQPYDSMKVARSSSQAYVTEVSQPFQTLDRYLILSTLGQGSYATVKLARDKSTEKLVAIKIYSKAKLCNQQRKQSLKREIHILKLLDHSNIISYINTIETHNEINLIVEYGGAKSLRTYLKQFPNRRLEEDEAKFIFKQVVKAVEYCHSLSIVHRDIKLENVLLKDNKDIKLIDFGFSVLVNRDCKLGIFCGTPSYMAPELVNKQEYFGKPVDIWALGVLLYVLLAGHFPFKGKDDTELYAQIRKGAFNKLNVSAPCQKLISQMLTLRASERITALRILQDRWLNS